MMLHNKATNNRRNILKKVLQGTPCLINEMSDMRALSDFLARTGPEDYGMASESQVRKGSSDSDKKAKASVFSKMFKKKKDGERDISPPPPNDDILEKNSEKTKINTWRNSLTQPVVIPNDADAKQRGEVQVKIKDPQTSKIYTAGESDGAGTESSEWTKTSLLSAATDEDDEKDEDIKVKSVVHNFPSAKKTYPPKQNPSENIDDDADEPPIPVSMMKEKYRPSVESNSIYSRITRGSGDADKKEMKSIEEAAARSTGIRTEELRSDSLIALTTEASKERRASSEARKDSANREDSSKMRNIPSIAEQEDDSEYEYVYDYEYEEVEVDTDEAVEDVIVPAPKPFVPPKNSVSIMQNQEEEKVLALADTSESQNLPKIDEIISSYRKLSMADASKKAENSLLMDASIAEPIFEQVLEPSIDNLSFKQVSPPPFSSKTPKHGFNYFYMLVYENTSGSPVKMKKSKTARDSLMNIQEKEIEEPKIDEINQENEMLSKEISKEDAAAKTEQSIPVNDSSENDSTENGSSLSKSTPMINTENDEKVDSEPDHFPQPRKQSQAEALGAIVGDIVSPTTLEALTRKAGTNKAAKRQTLAAPLLTKPASIAEESTSRRTSSAEILTQGVKALETIPQEAGAESDLQESYKSDLKRKLLMRKLSRQQSSTTESEISRDASLLKLKEKLTKK